MKILNKMLKYGIVVLNALKIISSKYFSKNDLENGQKNVISYFGSKILICYKTSIDFKNNAKCMNRNSTLIMIFPWWYLSSLSYLSCVRVETISIEIIIAETKFLIFQDLVTDSLTP